MYCPNCGTQLSDSAKFCHRCGQPMVAEEPGAQALAEVPAAPVRRRLRRVLIGCAGPILLGLFLCGAAATALYFWLDFGEPSQAATLVRAEETAAFASFSPSPLQMVHLWQLRNESESMAILAPVAVLPGVAQAGEVAREHLPLDLQIDPATDILPWIGREISVAVLEQAPVASARFERSARLAAQLPGAYDGPPLVLSVATRNPARTATFLAKARSQMEAEGVVFVNTSYRDLLITEIDTPAELPLAYATFNEMLVLATDAATLRGAIDTTLNDTATVLGEASAFQETLDGLPSNRLGFVYLDAQTLISTLEVPPQLWQAYSARHVGLSMALRRDGIRVDYLLDFETDGLDPLQEAWLRLPRSENRFTEQAPADCLFYVSGQNLLLLLESFLGQELRHELRQLEDREGLAVWDALVELSHGEYAVTFIEDRAGVLGDEVPLSLLLLADVEDPQRVERALYDIGAEIAQIEGASFYQDEINRSRVWLLEDESNDATFGYGINGRTIFIGTSYDALRSATQLRQSSLASSRRFQTATRPLPRQFRDYLYLDVQRLMRILERSSRDKLDDDLGGYLDAIDTVSLAVTPLDTRDRLHAVMFIASRD